MPIFQLQRNEPPQLTKAEKQVQVKQQIQSVANQGFNGLVKVLQTGLMLVWENPNGLNPQEVFDALGVDAKAHVLAAQAFINVVNMQVPGAVNNITPLPIVLNDDGTVTVQNKPST